MASKAVGLRSVAAAVIAAWLLSACGPSGTNGNQESIADERLQCLDKICPGDAPSRVKGDEELLKLNGHWYSGPHSYFSRGINGASFEWWNHQSIKAHEKRPADLQELVRRGHGYDASVEIFLRTNPNPVPGPSIYELLIAASKEPNAVDRHEIRSGLEMWKTPRGFGGYPATNWYLATHQRDENGEPPIAGCDAIDGVSGRCTMAFRLTDNISADIRFSVKNANDWPEIHQEISRVVGLLKEVN